MHSWHQLDSYLVWLNGMHTMTDQRSRSDLKKCCICYKLLLFWFLSSIWFHIFHNSFVAAKCLLPPLDLTLFSISLHLLDIQHGLNRLIVIYLSTAFRPISPALLLRSGSILLRTFTRSLLWWTFTPLTQLSEFLCSSLLQFGCIFWKRLWTGLRDFFTLQRGDRKA